MSLLPSTARWGVKPTPDAPAVSDKPALDQAVVAADAAKKELKKVVLDSGAIIKGRRLESLGDAFWTIKEVLSEVRDSNARHVLETLTTELTVREVDPDALKFVTNFSKLTGDFPRLSATDLKVMALTYQLEKQFNGSAHLNDKPKPAPAVRRTIEEEDENEADENEEDEGGGLHEGEQEEDGEDVDPSEFERVPLHDGSWSIPSRPTDSDAVSNCGSMTPSQAARRKQLVNLPGWYDGEDDNEGWITPDTIKSDRALEAQQREDKDSTVACATTDFAMQNVLMQIGLRVVDLDGLVISTVKQFVLKCHACFKITSDTSLNFCPSCGNATMMRVSKFVQADGTITYSKGIKKFSTRGTKYTLPLPKQGRGKDDLVLREDQLLISKHRRRKPKAVVDEDGFTSFSSRVDMPIGQGDQEIVGMGYSGGGRRNPNARKGSGRR